MKILYNGSVLEVSNEFVIGQMLKHGGEKVVENQTPPQKQVEAKPKAPKNPKK